MGPGRGWRGALAVLGVVVASGLGACSGGQPGEEASAPSPSLPASTLPAADGVTVSLILSPEPSPNPEPLVVLVPGGGYTSADPSGMIPLAESLADSGADVATLTYRTAAQGSYFPVPAQDVACGVAVAAAEVARPDQPASEVVVLGHSAGATLAALVALDPESFASHGGCPDPPVAPDRLIGLAGPYDVTQAPYLSANLFGPDVPDPADWGAGNPLALADQRPEVPALLVHGSSDALVPVALTEDFATALESARHEVTTAYPDGVDHDSVYSAEVAAPLVSSWLGLTSEGS